MGCKSLVREAWREGLTMGTTRSTVCLASWARELCSLPKETGSVEFKINFRLLLVEVA